MSPGGPTLLLSCGVRWRSPPPPVATRAEPAGNSSNHAADLRRAEAKGSAGLSYRVDCSDHLGDWRQANPGGRPGAPPCWCSAPPHRLARPASPGPSAGVLELHLTVADEAGRPFALQLSAAVALDGLRMRVDRNFVLHLTVPMHLGPDPHASVLVAASCCFIRRQALATGLATRTAVLVTPTCSCRRRQALSMQLGLDTRATVAASNYCCIRRQALA